MKLYKFIISDKEYSVTNQKELALLFKLFNTTKKLSSVIHWNILMEIDNDLEFLITDYNGMLYCLKQLNEKNSFLLLVKLGDKLGDIIKDSSQLGEILSNIPEKSNKIRLLSILRNKHLSKIIKDARDLCNIFEWLFGESQKVFIDLLGKEFIKKVFMSTNEIIITLYYLTKENNDYLMNILSLDGVKHKIKTSNNFLDMYRGLTDKKALEFLKLFTKDEIKNFFLNQNEFYEFMLKLPNSKEKLILKYLKLGI